MIKQQCKLQANHQLTIDLNSIYPLYNSACKKGSFTDSIQDNPIGTKIIILDWKSNVSNQTFLTQGKVKRQEKAKKIINLIVVRIFF